MDQMTDVSQALAAFHADLNRIQTLAGTLSQVERRHYNELTRYDDQKLVNIAVEEQSGARQLGEIKQICLAMAQRIEEMRQFMAKKQGV